MEDDSRRPEFSDDREVEREIRSRRKFSIAEAIGREGADLMKGASPVTRRRRAELEVEQYLKEHLEDSEGALRIVLVRRVRESEILLESHYSEALEALRRIAGQVVTSESRLRQLVRAVDAEWGRIYSEQPFFELEGRAAHCDDPYTLSSVREALARLLAALEPPRGS